MSRWTSIRESFWFLPAVLCILAVVLATASSTYGPRLVRNFMGDRGNQFVLGVFTSTFLYSLLVLRSVSAPENTDQVFVPHLAVNLAVLLGVLAIGVLVYFINHIADSVQVSTLARQVRTELLAAVRPAEGLYPEELGLGHPMVVHRTLELAEQVGTATGDSAVRARLAEHVELLQQAFEARAPQERDLGRLREHVAQARGAL